jgi:hypothetical protein
MAMETSSQEIIGALESSMERAVQGWARMCKSGLRSSVECGYNSYVDTGVAALAELCLAKCRVHNEELAPRRHRNNAGGLALVSRYERYKSVNTEAAGWHRLILTT